MKKIINITAILSILALFSCVEKVVVNREVDSQNYGKMLLGMQTQDQFKKEPYKVWIENEQKYYKPDASTIEKLKKEKLNSYSILVFLGTWCSDSHREFPRLLQILDATKFPKSKLTIIGLSRSKASPNGEEVKYNIKRVPTIIVSKYGKEIGRIIESTKTGFLEKDLLEIIEKK